MLRLAGLALQGGNEARLLSCDEGACAPVDSDFQVETGTQDVFAQKTVLMGLLDGVSDILHRQRVLLPYVEVPLARADGVCSQHEPFQDAVGVPLEEAPVHVGARVSFVGVYDNVLGVAGGIAAELPFSTRGEPSAAPAAQVGILDLL